jgi:transposase
MKHALSNSETLTVGLDLSDRTAQACILDSTGSVKEEIRMPLTRARLSHWLSGLPPARVALEVGTHSPWVSRMLEKSGHEVLVANSRRLPLISRSDRKTDRNDAETLARIARLDPSLLAPVKHRGEQVQLDLSVIRARDGLVRARTAFVNQVRGSVKALGGRLAKGSTRSFDHKAAKEIPDALQPALQPILEMIGTLTERIRAYDRKIGAIARDRYPETALLQQVPGVGPLTALSYVLILEDPYRFPRSRLVGSYLGLCPRRHDSGQEEPQLRITKAGDRFLRRLLVGSAHYILGPFGPDTDLRRWGLRLAARGGKNAKKRAAVAVARKLAVLLHRLWVTRMVYLPVQPSTRVMPPAA